jgi:hypothetical protein
MGSAEFSMFCCRAALAAWALLALSGCTGGMGAAMQSVRDLLPSRAPTEATQLDPKFDYLRVTRGKRVALLWRGNVERSQPLPVDVYYSGQGDVVRVQNGRIVGALGLTTEWRRVDVVAPPWTAIAKSPEQARVVRTRDVMPGYLSGLREELRVRAVGAPSGSALRGIDPQSLAWFEESVAHRPAPGVQALPPTRYAVDLAQGDGTVMYAEQCLAVDLCFSWQRWSAAMQQASGR